jgi:hypothetical protein
MDSESPEGGYAGPDSETEAAKVALNLPEEDEAEAEDEAAE